MLKKEKWFTIFHTIAYGTEMTRRNKEDWLKAGFRILANEGAAKLTIDRLRARLGLTKGSFYHHFKSRADFVTALLSYWEREMTLLIIDETERETEPQSKIRKLTNLCIDAKNSKLEVAIRAWALRDLVVRAYQERVDAQRLDYLQKLCLELNGDKHKAVLMSKLILAVYIGSQQMVPGIAEEATRELYKALEKLHDVL